MAIALRGVWESDIQSLDGHVKEIVQVYHGRSLYPEKMRLQVFSKCYSGDPIDRMSKEGR